MDAIDIAEITPQQIPLLDAALRQLSLEMGDEHRAGLSVLEASLFGNARCCAALLATATQEPESVGISGELPLGAAYFSPMFSTVTGGPGVYVSDLWVAPRMRGSGLGKRLLGAAIRAGRSKWNACFLRLATHDHNPRALAFYQHLGFGGRQGETQLFLSGSDLEKLAGN